MKVPIFLPNFSILFIIMKTVLSPFDFVCSSPDLGLDELEVLLVISLGGDVGSLRATFYML